MAEAKTKKELTPGMYNVEFIKDVGSNVKGTKAIYHSSTAQTLSDKGLIKIVDKIEVYFPKAAKK